MEKKKGSVFDMEYTIYVVYHAKPGCREAFVRRLEESGAAAKVRAEDGCLAYDYYLSAQDENTVLLIEKWQSKQHQEIHLTQPHIADIRAAKAEFIEDSYLGEFKLV